MNDEGINIYKKHTKCFVAVQNRFGGSHVRNYVVSGLLNDQTGF